MNMNMNININVRRNLIMPDDLLFEIFKTVSSVKTLYRLRCVCKSWNSVISTSSFIVAHHRHHHYSASPKSCLLLKRADLVAKFQLFSFYHPDQGAPLDHRTTFRSLPFEEFPFRTRGNPLIFIDVIRGVVCLTSPTLLWNPTIHKYVVIPDSLFIPGRCHDNKCYAPSLGFGFNSHEDDFRVVRLWMPIQPRRSGGTCCRLPLVYEVFSSQKGLWRKADASRVILPGKVISETSFFMNGTIHWIVSAYKVQTQKEKKELCAPIEYHRLLMFDCEHEEFTATRLPRAFNCSREKIIKASLFKFQGMLSIMIATLSCYELWVMKEYARPWKQLWSLHRCRPEFYGLVAEESMFLMDAKTDAVSYAKKHHNNDGKICYEVAGKTYEHILI